MKWLDQSSPLPAQVSRQISAISICATIGTGIFILTLPNSLREAGPAGVLLAYTFTSTVVYATCISNAEMMSYMPDAGGLVGLADIFVDPALGFAIGWSSWYNWAILIPDYLGIAANLITSYVFPETPTRESTTLVNVIGAFLLVMVVFMNCLRAERVGSVHSVFALVKLATLAVLIVSALFIALIPVPLCNTSSPPHNCNTPGSKETLTNIHIGGSYWRRPGPFAQIQFGLFYKPGNGGRIAGVFNVLIQSLFSFNGTETLSIVGRELINPATVSSAVAHSHLISHVQLEHSDFSPPDVASSHYNIHTCRRGDRAGGTIRPRRSTESLFYTWIAVDHRIRHSDEESNPTLYYRRLIFTQRVGCG
ncbi:amino acid permease-domain-containing protein [Auriculariales sp. MPI-PUGE-AT-0066]|nr:amino acid permease-domain-containing protein [Auriculariales sp. MPI-PUGE-AT-0066]